MKYLLYILSFSFIFLGCSSKEYFEPSLDKINYLSDTKLKKTVLEAPIKTFNKNGATLENQAYITTNGLQDTKLEKDFIYLNESDNSIISADNSGKIMVDSTLIKLDKVVVAASKKDNLISIVFIDNSIALYDLTKKQIVFKEYYTESLANDIRITNPIFMNNIILYPTLDGKVIVVSIENPKVLRTIIVDSSTKFNNITFFETLDQSLIASTANQIISLSSTRVISKKFEVRDIIKKDNYLYVATLDGQILKLDSALNVIAQVKYKYAKIYSLGAKDNHIYALESQQYIIQLDEELQNEKIYSFRFKDDAKSVTINDKIYFQRMKFDNKTLKSYKEDFYITLP